MRHSGARTFDGRTLEPTGLVATLAIVALAISGCGGEPTRVPKSPPDISGQITMVDPAGERIGTIRVEAVPQDSSGSAKAVVRVGQVTTVIAPGGRSGSFETLAIGQSVRVWFSGQVRETYPVQAAASTVVIDAAAP
jgi:hypothetical protein